MHRLVLALALCLLLGSPAFGQSQAVNGTIEGTVADVSGAVLPGVTVTVTNTDTGASSAVVTNEKGVYRALLLPLGRYKVSAELQGFKKFEQSGITLSAGQTALVNVTLGVGAVSETVTVTAESPIAEPGKIDLGRTISDTEITNLPLVSRNPYNFAFLQANVTGYENNEFGVPRINANGIADAHQLPARRQHQHREGPRRPAPAADLRGAGARGEGRHQRLRARVRPDDGHGLQRRSRRRAPTTSTGRRASASSATPCRRGRSSWRPPPASRTPRPTTSRRRSAGRSRRTSCTSSAPTSTSIAA